MRAATAIAVEPAAAWRPSETSVRAGRSVRRAVPVASPATVPSNATVTAEPWGTVTQRVVGRTTGVVMVRCSRRVSPSAQDRAPGRRTTTSTSMRSPGVTRTFGVRRPSCTASGTGLPAGVVARADSRLPAKVCRWMLASAASSPDSVTPDAPRTTQAAAATSRTGATMSSSQRVLTRRRTISPR